MATVYRVRMVIDGDDAQVGLHRSARAAADEAARWARRFPDAQIVMEGISTDQRDYGDERGRSVRGDGGPADAYRKDGWPLCPRCGEDELWSEVMMWWRGDTPRPTLADCFREGFGCYCCGWRGRVLPSPLATPNADAANQQ